MNSKRTILLATVIALALVGLLLAATGAWAGSESRSPAAPSTSADAISSTLFYQGRLLDSSGNPVEAMRVMTFSLYAQASGGASLWNDIFPVSVVDGLFDVGLEVNPDLFVNQQLWLGVQIEGDGQEMTPRQQLAPAPYALYALRSSWSGLSDVPLDLADGDDNTIYWAGPGLSLGNDTFEISTTYRLPQACGDGDIAEWNGTSGTWHCGSDDVGEGEAAWLLGGNAGTTPGTDVLGTNDGAGLTLVVDTVTALRLEPGHVPNLVGGDGANQVTAGAVGATIAGGGNAGAPNRVTDEFGTVSGGSSNRAGNDDGDALNTSHATVGGGGNNTASGEYATVGGGLRNTASFSHTTVGGGHANTASGAFCTVGGGRGNTASNTDATVCGGLGNVSSGAWASIGGGRSNSASRGYATVGGGGGNKASEDYATVGGGHFNFAEAKYATIAGGGPSNPAITPTNTTNNRVYDDYGTIGGGGGNRAGSDDGDSTNATFTTIGGGQENLANGADATVGGGIANEARFRATVSGGYYNTASGDYAAVGGGSNNTASDDSTTIGGGRENTASGFAAVVGGGYENSASGGYATVPGGNLNSAEGKFSFAAGRRAKANNQGCFAWGDSTDTDVTCGVDNRWVARASGGVYFYTSSDLSTGVYLASGGESWQQVSTSDRSLKENFAMVDGRQILIQLADIPITTWNYKASASGARHIGPMAQDFYAAFGVGEDNKHLSALDVNGVALAAIQGLYAQNVSLQAKSVALAEENAALQAQVDDLETRLAALEQAGAPYPTQAPTNWWLLTGLVIIAGGIAARRCRLEVKR